MTGQTELPQPPDFPVASSTVDAEQLLGEARDLTHGVPPVLRLDLLKARGWACVALEDELQGNAASRLAQACAEQGFVSGWGVEIPWTATERVPGTYRFRISARAFQALSKDLYLGSCFVLAETSGRFACTSDGDLYWMLAGPSAFVERAAGLPVADALARFGRTASTYGDTLAGYRLQQVQTVALAACAVARMPSQ